MQQCSRGTPRRQVPSCCWTSSISSVHRSRGQHSKQPSARRSSPRVADTISKYLLTRGNCWKLESVVPQSVLRAHFVILSMDGGSIMVNLDTIATQLVPNMEHSSNKAISLGLPLIWLMVSWHTIEMGKVGELPTKTRN